MAIRELRVEERGGDDEAAAAGAEVDEGVALLGIGLPHQTLEEVGVELAVGEPISFHLREGHGRVRIARMLEDGVPGGGAADGVGAGRVERVEHHPRVEPGRPGRADKGEGKDDRSSHHSPLKSRAAPEKLFRCAPTTFEMFF